MKCYNEITNILQSSDNIAISIEYKDPKRPSYRLSCVEFYIERNTLVITYLDTGKYNNLETCILELPISNQTNIRILGIFTLE